MDGYPDKKKMCHRTGFGKACRDLIDEGICQGRWVNVQGRNPQTDETLSRWGCVDDQAVLLQLSIEARLIGIQHAVEMRGNDTVKLLGESILRQERQHHEALQYLPRSAPALLALPTNEYEPQQLSLLDLQ